MFGSRTTLTQMSHFFKNIRGHGDSSQRYLRRTLRSLVAARAGVIMMGDSTLLASEVVMMCVALEYRPQCYTRSLHGE